VTNNQLNNINETWVDTKHVESNMTFIYESYKHTPKIAKTKVA